MRVAVIGSRNVDESCYSLVCKHIPRNASEIVSGGAVGVDSMAKRYAHAQNLPLRIIRPNYTGTDLYEKRRAPLARNREIVDYADVVIAFWDGSSSGTAYTIEYARKCGKPVQVIMLKKEQNAKQTLK